MAGPWNPSAASCCTRPRGRAATAASCTPAWPSPVIRRSSTPSPAAPGRAARCSRPAMRAGRPASSRPSSRAASGSWSPPTRRSSSMTTPRASGSARRSAARSCSERYHVPVAPLVDVTFTTSHVARLYASDGLLEKLDLAKLPASKDLAKEAFRSEHAIGGWAYVYTIAYRADQVKTPITKWADLWRPDLKGKIAMPDFDPSHIITISALLEGGNEKTWEKGQERLRQLKPSIAAFFSTDARSQDLMKTGEAPVEVMLSINAFHLRDQGLNITIVDPKDRPGILG